MINKKGINFAVNLSFSALDHKSYDQIERFTTVKKMFYHGNTISFVWGHWDLYKNEYNDHYLLVVPLIKFN